MNYDTLPSERRNELKAAAKRIRDRIKKTTEAMIEIGRALIEIKKSCRHGEWTHWVEAVLGMEMRTVQKFMDAAALANAYPDKNEKISLLQPTSVMRLGAPSCPVEAHQEVFERLDVNDIPLDREVAEIIKRHKPGNARTTTPEPDEKLNAAERLFAEMVDTLESGPADLPGRIIAHNVKFVIDGFKFDWPNETQTEPPSDSRVAI